MLVFALPPSTPSPRQTYLAAIADAEAQYVSALASQRDQSIRRRLLLSSVYQPDYLLGNYRSPFGVPSYEAQILAQEQSRIALLRRYQLEEEERRIVAAHRARQAEVEHRRVAIIRQQQEERYRRQLALFQQETSGCRLHRQREVGLRRKEQARQDKECIETFLRALLGASSEPARHNGDKPKVPAAEVQSEQASKPDVAQPTKVGTSLKEQLEKRLGNEYDNEIKDTIHAILASLFHPQPTCGPSTSQKKEDNPEDKGKGKAVSFDVPPTIPTSKDVLRSMEEINNVEAHFVALESEFVFPRNLDFTPPASPTSSDTESAIKLAYTSLNAPIHNYTHALSLLLGKLDAVESFGNEEVRLRRKEVVIRVEGALEDVERIVEEKGKLSRRASQGSLKKDNVAVEEERKVAAKEWIATEAFKWESPAPEDILESSPIVTSTNGDAPAVDGYDVGDVAMESVPVPVVAVEDAVSPADEVETVSSSPEQSNPSAEAVSPPIEQSMADARAIEEDSTSMRPVEENVSESESVSTIAFAERSPTSLNPVPLPTVAVAEPEPIDTFLMPASESLSNAIAVPLEEDVVVVDEGSDWSEVEEEK